MSQAPLIVKETVRPFDGSAERSTELTPKSCRGVAFATPQRENLLRIILRQAQDDSELDTKTGSHLWLIPQYR